MTAYQKVEGGSRVELDGKQHQGWKLPQSDSRWCIGRQTYHSEEDAFFESLLYITNGRLGMRATVNVANPRSRPGLFARTLYGATPSGSRQIINCLTPALFEVEVDGQSLEDALNSNHGFRQELDMQYAYLSLSTDFGCSQQPSRLVEQRIMLAMQDVIVSIIHLELSAGAQAVITPGVSFAHGNAALAGRTEAVRIQHLELLDTACHTDGYGLVCSNRTGAQKVGSYTKYWINDDATKVLNPRFLTGGTYARPIQLAPTNHSRLVQILVVTQITQFSSNSLPRACAELMRRESSVWQPHAWIASHVDTWNKRWSCAPLVEGDEELTMAARYGIFQTLQIPDRDAPSFNVSARGLSSEYHSGHFFFNTEFFLVPYYVYTHPEIAKALILHRLERTDAAMRHAILTGYIGARFPEEVDDEGNEAAPHAIKDIFSDDLIHEWSGVEVVHTSADVVYAIARYYEVTDDYTFLRDSCLATLVEICIYLSRLLKWDPEVSAYSARRVMGFDEFHYHVDHHFSTNWLCRWALSWVITLIDRDTNISCSARAYFVSRGLVFEEELIHWRAVLQNTYFPAANACGVFPVFEGYFDLPDQTKFTDAPITHSNLPVIDIQRADRMELFHTKLTKQADVLFLMQLFPDKFEDEQVKTNLDFYEPRTTHGSSLSMSAHAACAFRVGRTSAGLRLLSACLNYNIAFEPRSGYANGVHIAAYAGALLVIIENILRVKIVRNGRTLRIALSPKLPDSVQRIRMPLRFGNVSLIVMAELHKTTVNVCELQQCEAEIEVWGEARKLTPGKTLTFISKKGAE